MGIWIEAPGCILRPSAGKFVDVKAVPMAVFGFAAVTLMKGGPVIV